MIWMGVLAIIIVAAAIMAAGSSPWFHRSRRIPKVIRIASRRQRAKEGSQPCTLCKQRRKRLHYYSDEAGKVIGVCDKCRPKAERRGLLQL